MTTAEVLFNEEDLKQIQEKGLTKDDVLSQIETFRRGFPFSRLKRPCTPGDGIHVLGEDDLERLLPTYSQAALSGRAMKFVPASGAATRMFKSLLSFNSRHSTIDQGLLTSEAGTNDPDHNAFVDFLEGLGRFAFYGDLKKAMTKDGLDMEALIGRGDYKLILEYLLTSKGLNMADLPKGLIKFHAYPDHCRTPFEEHLAEAVAYVKDKRGLARLHFTVSPEHGTVIRNHLAKVQKIYEKSGNVFDIAFSLQSPSTDTIAVDMDNRPFREEDGRLLFRPGGHGALLENLNRLEGDIVFIKNIDNVVPDRLREETYTYKKALAGILVELERDTFRYLKKLTSGKADDRLLKEVFDFAGHRLSFIPPQGVQSLSKEEKVRLAVRTLNRPLRVCGMVKNEGEPGGGPFWVEHPQRGLSLRIVESSQVDMASVAQRKIWESATHFNPVDLVCGIRDYLGRPFDLMRFRDPQSGYISVKSKGGKELKALELPGLWNGAMAEWNSVFVEVPLSTFNPVKTVLDLLRKEHQAH